MFILVGDKARIFICLALLVAKVTVVADVVRVRTIMPAMASKELHSAC